MNKKMELLIFNAYHGELTESERETLSEWVMESPKNARELLEYSVDSHSITVALRSGRVAEAGTSLDSTNVFDLPNVDHNADELWSSNKNQESVELANAEEPARKTSFAKGIVAALVALTVCCGIFFGPNWIQLSQNNLEYSAAPPTELTEPPRPTTEPQEASDLIYYPDQSEESKALVVPECGYVCYRFENGFILTEGSATYQLGGDHTFRLIEGPIVAKVSKNSIDSNTFLIDGTEIMVQEAAQNQDVDDNVASTNTLENPEDITENQLASQTPATSFKSAQAGILRTHADVSTILGSLETRWLNESVVIKGLDWKSVY